MDCFRKLKFESARQTSERSYRDRNAIVSSETFPSFPRLLPLTLSQTCRNGMTLYTAVAREATELEDSSMFSAEQLINAFSMLHSEMRQALRKYGRREPSHALSYWKKCNTEMSFVSPRPFNNIIRAALSSQASSASAERLFSDLGRLEGRQRQSTLSSTLEMNETIRVFVQMHLSSYVTPQVGRTHPQATAFKRLVNQIATEVLKNK